MTESQLTTLFRPYFNVVFDMGRELGKTGRIRPLTIRRVNRVWDRLAKKMSDQHPGVGGKAPKVKRKVRAR